MKAKEWAARFATEDCMKVLKEFAGEILLTMTTRGSTDNAIEGALREGEQRWRATVELCPALKADQYIDYDFIGALEEVLGEPLFKRANELLTKRWVHLKKFRIHQNYKAACREADAQTDPWLRLGLRMVAYHEAETERAELATGG